MRNREEKKKKDIRKDGRKERINKRGVREEKEENIERKMKGKKDPLNEE